MVDIFVIYYAAYIPTMEPIYRVVLLKNLYHYVRLIHVILTRVFLFRTVQY
jgi:hypothetical protein